MLKFKVACDNRGAATNAACQKISNHFDLTFCGKTCREFFRMGDRKVADRKMADRKMEDRKMEDKKWRTKEWCGMPLFSCLPFFCPHFSVRIFLSAFFCLPFFCPRRSERRQAFGCSRALRFQPPRLV